MGNHYHLVVETREGNLSRGMRHLNGVYTQRFNRRHTRAGHVFQGRGAPTVFWGSKEPGAGEDRFWSILPHALILMGDWRVSAQIRNHSQ
jgi:hypothetical protein